MALTFWLICSNIEGSISVSSLPRQKRSPSRRSKSRWEPAPDEKLIDKPAPVNRETVKYSSWVPFNERTERDKKVFLFSFFLVLLQQNGTYKKNKNKNKKMMITAAWQVMNL